MLTLVGRAAWMTKMFQYCVIFAFLLHFSNSESTTKGVRLKGGDSQMEGRVEIWFNGQWQTICDSHWGLKEATVLCRQLDLGLFGLAEKGAIFGEGTGHIWNGRVSCNGSETSIMDCDTQMSDGDEWSRCGHSQDVGVICTSEMRLNGSKDSREGYLEIYSERKRQWALIKDDTLLDQNVVTAVCLHLRLGMEGSLVSVNGSSSDVGSGLEYDFLESLHDIVVGELPMISCFGDSNACLAENPCSSKGICIHEIEGNKLSCFCLSGFTGPRCEEADTRGMQMNFKVLMVLIPLVFLVTALVLVCVVLHHRKRKRNALSLVLDNGTSTTAKTFGKNEYVSLS